MTKSMTPMLLALAAIGAAATPDADAGVHCRQVRQTLGQPAAASASASVSVNVGAPAASSRVIYKVVQATPKYDLRRPELVSGSTVTLFANFLRNEKGYVVFNFGGATIDCNIIDWQPNSVTVEMPCLGLSGPKNAEVQIILPDGRIAKTFKVLYIPQPDLVVHADTMPQPQPPAPETSAATYAMPVRGGVVLQAE